MKKYTGNDTGGWEVGALPSTMACYPYNVETLHTSYLKQANIFVRLSREKAFNPYIALRGVHTKARARARERKRKRELEREREPRILE